jgi:hypothetical protein
MIKRTPKIRALMDHAIQLAIDMLEHPSMPAPPENRHIPQGIARALDIARLLLNHPGVLHRKKEVMSDLQAAADYLSQPEVRSLNFAIRPFIVAGNLREIIRDLK